MREERRAVALLLVDVINALDYPGSDALARAAMPCGRRILRLAARARTHRVPVVYVNDNFGRWRSDFRATVEACSAEGMPGAALSRLLKPDEHDYFILKPQNSGFYMTSLELLLEAIGVHTVVIVGFSANQCVLFTANDAHMRGYRIVVPEDCTASNSSGLTRAALGHVREALHAETTPAARVRFDLLAKRSPRPRAHSMSP
jgi:nicotinamidase-related amidase